VAGSCECRIEYSVSIKSGKILVWLRSRQLLEKDSAPLSHLLIYLEVLLSSSS